MTARTIFVGSDHGGFTLKQHLVARLTAAGYTVHDLGCHDTQSCDYPVFAHEVSRAVLQENALGILICGTGLGMSMAANRQAGIRAALCTNEFMARMSREHNDANVLCLGERVIGLSLADTIVDAFLTTEFAGGRHQRRVGLIELPTTH